MGGVSRDSARTDNIAVPMAVHSRPPMCSLRKSTATGTLMSG
jgi:hypothetical protein